MLTTTVDFVSIPGRITRWLSILVLASSLVLMQNTVWAGTIPFDGSVHIHKTVLQTDISNDYFTASIPGNSSVAIAFRSWGFNLLWILAVLSSILTGFKWQRNLNQSFVIYKYTILGFITGLTFLLISAMMSLYLEGYKVTISNFMIMHSVRPVVWMLDLSPIFMALVGYYMGSRQKQILNLNLQMQDQIHDQNKELHVINEELSKLSLVASKTQNYVFITNENLEVEWVNDGFSQLTGDSLDAVKGKHALEVLLGEEPDQVIAEKLNNKFAVCDPFSDQIPLISGILQDRFLSFNVTPVTVENGLVNRYIVVGSDSTNLKKTETKLERNAAKMRSLNEISVELLNKETHKEICETTIKELMNHVPDCYWASTAMFDFDSNKAEFFSFKSENGKMISGTEVMSLNDIDSMPELLMHNHRLVEDLDLQKDLSPSEEILKKRGVKSYVVVPLIRKGKLIGSLNISSKVKDVFSFADIQFVKDVSNLLSVSLQQHQMNVEMKDMNAQLSTKNKHITDSINYAKRIQEGILPKLEIIQSVFPETFIYYKPKDIISGDLYWFTIKKNKAIIATVDCTGHGVPGSLMSMIANNLLNQIVNVKNLVEPAQILEQLNKEIRNVFNHRNKEENTHDGMDIALASIDLSTNKLQFAGAHRPLIYIKDGEFFQVRGDHHSIAVTTSLHFQYTQTEIDLNKGDVIYLFTDGFYDQFGGVRKKKFYSTRFNELLQHISDLEMSKQENILNETLKHWKGDNPQIDDILVMGLRI
ncbi:MAG: SpoIIE family protein phosphatase [Bacteroidetes bacterium]|nr:SpoIIE family protein phosphatase [Bacteroidota bacterium]